MTDSNLLGLQIAAVITAIAFGRLDIATGIAIGSTLFWLPTMIRFLKGGS